MFGELDNRIEQNLEIENHFIIIKRSSHKEDWRNEFEKTRFNLEGDCLICGRQEYLHCKPNFKSCPNDFERIDDENK